MANDLQTPKEVARQLDIAPSTLRAWSLTFASLLSEHARPAKEPSGRVARRLYSAPDVQTLTRAKALLASGLTLDRTLTILRTEPAPPALVDDPRALVTTDLGHIMLVMADQKDVLSDHHRELDALRSRLDALEREHRPFWRRVFGR